MPPERFGVAQNWQSRFNKVLISFVVASLIYLGQKLLIQVVSVDYHRRQFAQRIKDNKGDVRFLSQLYEASRRLFPDYTEFREEDYIIHQTLNIPGMKGQNGVNTPMRNILENVQAARGKVTSVFGGLANEVAGNKKGVSSSYNITVSALHKKRGAEALATRIWMSFVPEGSTALTLEDLKEVMGEELEAQAEDCFHSLDRDDNVWFLSFVW